MQTYFEAVNAMTEAMVALENGLKRLAREAENLPLADIREWLLFHLATSEAWVAVNDLKMIKGTMILAITIVEQERQIYAHYVGEDLKRELQDICNAIDLIFRIGRQER